MSSLQPIENTATLHSESISETEDYLTAPTRVSTTQPEDEAHTPTENLESDGSHSADFINPYRAAESVDPSPEATESKVLDDGGGVPSYTAFINDKERNDALNFPSNQIRTHKYTLQTFLFINLFEQFRRIANVYFLLTAILAYIPKASPFPQAAAIVPLCIIIGLTMVKDGWEDYLRYKEDCAANAIAADRLNPTLKIFETVPSSELKVGDIIRIKRGQEIPADCITLASATEDGTCYIDTASLDGESAPKVRRSVRLTAPLRGQDAFSMLRGEVDCNQNTKALHGFTGRIKIQADTVPQPKQTHTSPRADDANDFLSAQTGGSEDHGMFKQRTVTMSADDKPCYLNALGDEHFLFRSARLVNTDFVFAFVLFVGAESTLMLNRNETPWKFSQFEVTMNRCIATIFVFVILVCLLEAIAAALSNSSVVQFQATGDARFNGLALNFASWLILTSWMIPLSLYITIEVVKLGQAQLIWWDEKMTFVWGAPDSDDVSNRSRANSANSIDSSTSDSLTGEKRRARVKNTSLNEELGHVEYIFTDKTGTLTQNQMELSRLSVNGRKYINDAFSAALGMSLFGPNSDLLPFSKMVQTTIDTELHHEVEQNRRHQEERELHFLWTMVLCSDTLPIQNARAKAHQENGRTVEETSGIRDIEYTSPSPDEVAFAEALADHGIVFEDRAADGGMHIRLCQGDNRETSVVKSFQVLATLQFEASRKRMTVIVEDEDHQIFLYSKGADQTMFEMITEADASLVQQTRRHVTSYAKTGSRTMVLAGRPLTQEQYADFQLEYEKAEMALTRRAEKIERAFSIVENSLSLLGCTAVEDQMQEGVPESVLLLKEAGIKVVMITGDKEETAISIGRQSQIISTEIGNTDLMLLQAHIPQDINDDEGLHREIDKIERAIDQYLVTCTHNISVAEENGTLVPDTALICNGDALELSLVDPIKEKFIRLFVMSTSVVCNRANPSQKAMFVSMAKSALNGVVLAIGDGANDVSMIQASNVGVGMMGKEGTQAALAADFVIHKFRHLPRLLLIHGRQCFLRTGSVVLLFLYKNTTFMIPLCYYGFFSLYSAQRMWDVWMMTGFNLFLTGGFPLAVGWFEQDLTEDTLLNHPLSYYAFRINPVFTYKKFLGWMWTGFWQSVMIFFVSYFMVQENHDILTHDGKNGGIWLWGAQMLLSDCFVVSIKMQLETYHWNALYHISTLVGLFGYFVGYSVIEGWVDSNPESFLMMTNANAIPTTWLLLMAQLMLCLLPGVVFHLYERERNASLTTVLREAERKGYLTLNGKHRLTIDVVRDYGKR